MSGIVTDSMGEVQLATLLLLSWILKIVKTSKKFLVMFNGVFICTSLSKVLPALISVCQIPLGNTCIFRNKDVFAFAHHNAMFNPILWFNPSWQQSDTAACLLSSDGIGERIGKVLCQSSWVQIKTV